MTCRRASLRVLLAGLLAALAALCLAFPAAAPAQDAAADGPLVLVTPVKGAVGPPATRQIETLIEDAAERDAALAVIELDTPGGLVTSTRDINRAILASPVPVAVHIAPPGARAASAGTYIAYAAHVAAMAPGTNLGAATPIAMGGAPGSGDDESDGASSQSPSEAKSVNDAVASIRSLAELRGRNADWAEAAVREAASIGAEEAVERDVVDHLAADTAALLAAADGSTVSVAGEERTLALAGARIERVEPGWVTEVLSILTNPNVALLLMALGFYGLVFEFANPGLGPGVAGAILLLLGLYALNMLPVNYAGLALLGLGLALMAGEALSPSFGVLGLGGIIAFGLGSALLIDTDVPQFQLSWTVVVSICALSLAVLVLLLGAVLKTRRQPARAAIGTMTGSRARVLSWEDGRGQVLAHGERWQASGPVGLAPGDEVEIDRVEGLTLRLRGAPLSRENSS